MGLHLMKTSVLGELTVPLENHQGQWLQKVAKEFQLLHVHSITQN